MRLSKHFLKEYIDIEDLSYEKIAEKMVFAGNEYETFEKFSNAEGLVIGKVVSCIPHPESDHLHICEVDYKEGIKQIVCGAPNVKEGIKVIVAKVGAILPGGIIKKATLAGTLSEGMLCSLEELGIESKYIKEEEKKGIHILEEDAPIGADAIQYLGYDDEIIDFELTANRADLLSILGMAYEVGAIFDRKVKLPSFEVEENNENLEDFYKLDVKTENCFQYLGKMVKNVTIKESPRFIQNRLIASGIRPINNVVDISNYVMLIYGQPLHFFDADKIGGHIIVRNALDKENFITLDGKERTLCEKDLVITSEKEIACLAGVMGGLTTEVTEETKNIFIESAIFEPLNIRFTSKRILRSEASARFEKGIDPARSEMALKEACYLLKKYADGEVVGGMLKYDTISKEDKKIEITLEKINRVLGMELSIEEVKGILKRLDFTYKENQDKIEIFVPTRRLDVNLPCDIIEEIGRIHGYEHLKGQLPIVPIKNGSRTFKQKRIKEIRKKLNQFGLNQVRTYSLVGEKEAKQFLFRDFEPIVLLDPMSEERKILRRTLIPSLINVYDYNKDRDWKDVSIFEIASVYYKKEEKYEEETMISGLLTGNVLKNTWNGTMLNVDFYFLKGIICELLEYLGYQNRYSFDTENLLSSLHPYKSCFIKIDNEIVGYMGVVHPGLVKQELFVFELSLEKIMSKKVRNIKYKEVSKFPSMKKDVAFIVNKEVLSETIENIIKKTAGRYLKEITVFDVYTGKNIEENQKSIAYSLTFNDPTKTLTDEEVMKLFGKIIEAVETKIGAKLRDR